MPGHQLIELASVGHRNLFCINSIDDGVPGAVLKSEVITGDRLFEIARRCERRRPLRGGITAEDFLRPRSEIQDLTGLLLQPRLHGHILSSGG
jgi:hypothetical protein